MTKADIKIAGLMKEWKDEIAKFVKDYTLSISKLNTMYEVLETRKKELDRNWFNRHKALSYPLVTLVVSALLCLSFIYIASHWVSIKEIDMGAVKIIMSN